MQKNFIVFYDLRNPIHLTRAVLRLRLRCVGFGFCSVALYCFAVSIRGAAIRGWQRRDARSLTRPACHPAAVRVEKAPEEVQNPHCAMGPSV